MTSFDKIAQPIGLGIISLVIFGTCYGGRLIDRENEQYHLSCRLRWSHAEPNPVDSIRIAKLCGSEGMKK